MKKTIILSLAAALALSSSSAIAQAKPVDAADNTGAKNQTIRIANVKTLPGKQIPAEISGVIEEITENEMKVKVKEGEVYLVPLGLFSKLEGFNDLGLGKNVDVSLKSVQAIMSEPITLKIDSEESAEAGKADITHKIIRINPDKLNLDKAENETVTFSISSKPALPADVKLFEAKEGGQLFFASEITANGKTVKLDIQAAKAAEVGRIQAQPSEISGTVQSIGENEMTVKTGDEKVYWIPLAAFEQMEEFKELELKEGTEVVLKNSKLLFTTAAAGKDNINFIKIIGSANGEAALVEGTSEAIPVQEEAVTVTVETEEGSAVVDPGKTRNIKIFDSKALSDGRLIFIAGEISANGKTVKLSR